jgi:hypothetical protein
MVCGGCAEAKLQHPRPWPATTAYSLAVKVSIKTRYGQGARGSRSHDAFSSPPPWAIDEVWVPASSAVAASLAPQIQR